MLKIRYKKSLFLLTILLILSGCDYSQPQNRTGFFYDYLFTPINNSLYWLGSNLHNNYGLAIIIIVLVIRIILLPFMLGQYKNSHEMREKMKFAKPDLSVVQEKVKRARTQEEKIKANQEMMEVYKKYDMNPMKSMLGCFPTLIQMPIILALYYVLKYPTTNGITNHPDFLWFDLTKPDIIITFIAGALYFIQGYLSKATLPEEQKSMGYMMMIFSPFIIIFVSFSSSAALGLYWSVSAAFLVVQMFLANKYYSRKAKEKASSLKMKFASNKGKHHKNTKVVAKKKRK
ncbi:membrane protein insertase YidC [Staphylococcus agnetis]|uniref:membrane protein insertase YidC n=1 Tax=Staphylococcus agnetis TaxID=985762 RepID=UPI00208E51E4|nr:membrane protein insertase YidC [Staphylococcus agnetis]MCO4349238.1 membrane protein insertase YidC [Staphylococcus agnetis]